MSVVIATTFAQLFKVVIEKVPDIIRAFKEPGGGKVRKEDDKVVKMLYEMQEQQAQTAETIERMREMIQVLLQRLEDTSMTSSEDRRTREEVSAELRNLLADAGISPEDLSSGRGDERGANGDNSHVNEPSSRQPRDNEYTQRSSEPSYKDTQVLTCEVCTEIYDRGERLPLILTQCGHTFCRKCLDKINLKKKFKCPSCRQDQDQFKNLPTNYALLDILEGANLTEMTKQPESDHGTWKEYTGDEDMSYDEEMALAIFISSKEPEKEEYNRLTAELLHGVEEDRRRRTALEEEEEVGKQFRQLDREADLAEEENQCWGFSVGCDGEVEMLDEMNTQREWEDEKKKKEKRRKRRKLKEQEDLELALAMSLSIQDGEGKNSNY